MEMGIVNSDGVPGYRLVFAGYEEWVATGRLRQAGPYPADSIAALTVARLRVATR